MKQDGKYYKLFKLNKKAIDIGTVLLSIVKIPTYLKFKNIRGKNKVIKTLKNSKRCYICGLGPSLKNVDLTKLDGDIIAVNRFYKFAEENNLDIKPVFYCLLDDMFYKEAAIEDTKKAFARFKETNFMLNGKYINDIKPYTKDDNNNFYIFLGGKQISNKTKLDFTKLIPIANNVLNTAILLAIYSGYEEIVLLGADFNSFASSKKNHCYIDEIENRELSLGFELYCYSLVAADHAAIALYAKQQGIKIYNATQDSLIDAYEKIKLNN